MKKMKIEPYSDLIDQTFSQFNENSINNQDPHSQIESDEMPGAKCRNENDSEDKQINKSLAIPNYMPKILLDDEVTEGINSLNSKQREVFSGSYMDQRLFKI